MLLAKLLTRRLENSEVLTEPSLEPKAASCRRTKPLRGRLRPNPHSSRRLLSSFTAASRGYNWFSSLGSDESDGGLSHAPVSQSPGRG
jgi:hypothetical protein